MKNLWLLIAVLIGVFMSGCADPSNVVSELIQLPTGEIVTAATGRHGSAERSYVARMDAVKAGIELEKIKEQKKDQVIIKIDSKDEMTAFALYKANENMRVAMETMGVALRAMSGQRSDYEVMFAAYQVPEGAFAEGIKAVGTAGRDLLGTPASMLVAGGYAAGEFFKGYDRSGQSNYVSSNGGDIDFVSKRSAVSIGDSNTETYVSGQNLDGGTDGSGDGDDGSTNLGTCSGDRGSTPIIRVDDDGTQWVSSGCSCDSWLAGHCDV